MPNILKVLNPLFLDDLREKLAEAAGNARKLLNLRNRIARIRVFDPACGSGNFLVIAYKELREIEAEINRRRGEADRASDISLKNFRGTHTSFKWANLASHNAGVTVVIVGISNHAGKVRRLYSQSQVGDAVVKESGNINAYLVPYQDIVVNKRRDPLCFEYPVEAGGKPVDGGNLFLDHSAKRQLLESDAATERYVMRAYGAEEYTNGKVRHCLWISDDDAEAAKMVPAIRDRLERTAAMRAMSAKAATRRGANWPHRFEEVKQSGFERVGIIPKLTAESREFIPAGLLPPRSIVTDLAFALYDAPVWHIAIIASRMHFIWIATVCGKFKTDYRYSNTLGWNTFPIPTLSDQNKADLMRSAEDILLAREAHFPATIAELYDPDEMPDNLREAHERNDELLERIYIGRRFKNDTERLEKLFELYSQFIARQPSAKKTARRKSKTSEA